MPSACGGGTSTAAMPSCPGGGTWTAFTTGAAATGGRVGGAGRGAGRGAGCWYTTGAGYRGSRRGLNVIGRLPMGPQPAGVHPAPERPGMSVNHITTPTSTGTVAQNAALRIRSLAGPSASPFAGR